MIEQGTEQGGWEYKRTSNDFTFRWLQQDNCVCSVCHGTGAKIEFRYITRDYESDRVRNKICKNLQAHEHSFWICPKCLKTLVAKQDKTMYIKDLVNEVRADD